MEGFTLQSTNRKENNVSLAITARNYTQQSAYGGIIPTSNQHKTKLFKTTSTGSKLYYLYSFEISINGITKNSRGIAAHSIAS